MEQPEIEQLVGEAETRVERLRSLYDQYFMGIEKIEPQTARKDVERRIQQLRKTQIRNTALRFRFQNVLLRYNTFSAHWMRICRQIEDGTYKHHLRKAKERFDPKVTARDTLNARKEAAALQYGDTLPPGPPEFELSEDVDVDVDFDDPVAKPDIRAALRSYAIPQEGMAPSVSGRALASMKTEKSLPPEEPRRVARDASLDRATDPAPPPVPSKAPPPLPARAGGPAVPGRPPPVPGRLPPPTPGARPPVPAGATQPAPPPALKPGPAATPAARPAPVPLARPVPAPTAKPAPAPAPAARPAPAPIPAARPAPAVAVKAAPVAVRPGASGDEGTRAIYSKYVETRRSQGESTATITSDSFAKTLNESREKLQQKHPGKKVDFDVQVKDGKTILKPIVR